MDKQGAPSGSVRTKRIIITPATTILLGIILAGCSILIPEPKAEVQVIEWEQFHYTLEAEFEIVDWEQSYYSSLGSYGPVRINYRITNTGTLAIRYYKVWFEVQCADGTKFREWTNGLDIEGGTFETSTTYVDTAEKRAVSVSRSDYELSPPIGTEPRGLVRIDYIIKNTGPVDIDYYKIWFEVHCIDDSIYTDWTNGYVKKGQMYTGMAFVEIETYSDAVSVSVSDYELTHHSIWY